MSPENAPDFTGVLASAAGTPKFGYDCHLCEDWGTTVLIDDRGEPVGTAYCICERGRVRRAKEGKLPVGVEA